LRPNHGQSQGRVADKPGVIVAELVLLNWQIGNRIRRDILQEARAEYGDQIVSTLSRQLTTEYGAGFSRQNLFHMMRFVDAWPDRTQVMTLAQHLGWSHFKEILYLDNELARQFYAEMCRLERWSVRTLRDRISSKMFERTAISRLPEAAIRQDLQQLREADKEFHDLEIDRTSCTRFWANQFRVLLTAAAYVLMQELRLRAAGTACARAQVLTLRERLLKLGARVIVSARRWVIHLPTSFPFLPAFRLIACRWARRADKSPTFYNPTPDWLHSWRRSVTTCQN
jgi:DUF1016 N-terminal domain/Transposase DDE domain group 1